MYSLVSAVYAHVLWRGQIFSIFAAATNDDPVLFPTSYVTAPKHVNNQVEVSESIFFAEIANCESDIAFFAARHDADTRQWLLKDFDKWFSDPGDSRAYVLLGYPGVGKSVMAGVLAQRWRKAGHLGAAYFCRHNDSTRNDPRCLLGTIASQLCECSSQYNSIVGGESGIRKLLSNSNLGVQELFTKLLQEPLHNLCATLPRES